MKSPRDLTIGDVLRRAEDELARRGGFSAVADYEVMVVRLFFTTADGIARTVTEAPPPDGVAGKDVARDLLDGHAGQADPAALRFARETYFPIDFQ